MQIAISHGHRDIVDLLKGCGGRIVSAEMAYTLCDLAANDNYESFKVKPLHMAGIYAFPVDMVCILNHYG